MGVPVAMRYRKNQQPKSTPDRKEVLMQGTTGFMRSCLVGKQTFHSLYSYVIHNFRRDTNYLDLLMTIILISRKHR